jgi:malonate decarboxylase delta subunit
VRTSVDGFDEVWTNVLTRFFTEYPAGGKYEINDFGATPGMVTLRLRQALQEATR